MNPPQTVGPDEYATKIRALLRQEQRVLAVVENQRFLGIVNRQDIMLITSTKSNLKARDIMSQPVITVAPDEDVYSIGRKMIKHDAAAVPVTDISQLLGVVFMEDVIHAVYRPSQKKVRDIMTTEVVACDHTEEITKVWNLMEFHKLTGLPVTEDVSTSHRRYTRLAGFVTLKDILQRGDLRPGADRQRFTHPPPVEKAMTRTPKYVYPDDSIDRCVELFEKHDIGRLPVVKNGFELLGIVDREDVLKTYL